MKSLIAITSSVAVAAAVFVALVAIGLVKISEQGSKHLFEQLSEQTAEISVNVNEILAKHPEESVVEKISGLNPISEIAQAPANERTTDEMNGKVLQFLASQEAGLSDDLEERFRVFLNKEFSLEKAEIDMMLKQCFWKNFVTLQKPMRHDDFQKMQSDFELEKSLKLAGFKAKGLVLFEGEVQEAELRFSQLQSRYSVIQNEGGGL